MKKLLTSLGKTMATAIIISAFALMISPSAMAQKKWSIELRGGADYATKKLGDADITWGLGFEGTIAYRFIPSLGVYAGWSWNNFASDKTFEGSKLDFNETGYCFGLQFIQPIGESKVSFMLKGGATYNHIETENSEGEIIDDSGHGFGWQAGTGLSIAIGNRVNIIPELRYRALSRDITLDNVVTPVELNYISGSVGISFSF